MDASKSLIKDDQVILTHSRSRNVQAALVKAHQNGKQFKVYITEAQPLCEGYVVIIFLDTDILTALVMKLHQAATNLSST